MSWIGRTYREVAREFHERRMRAEGFAKPFVQPTPQYLLLKALACYPLRGEDFFYMPLREYTDLLLLATKEVARVESWDRVYEFAIAMRRAGMVKDPPLVSAQVWPDKGKIAELLGTYPAPKMLLFAEIAKKFSRQYAWGWGRRKKGAIAAALAAMPLRWHETQAIKHRSAVRDLLRIVHPRPPSQEIGAIWRWAAKGGEPPTDRIAAYERALKAQDAAEAVRIAIDADLPWEVVRSRVGHLDALPPELLAEAAARIMTPHDVAMQASAIVERAGEAALARALHGRRVPMSAGARAALGLYEQGRRLAARLFFDRVRLPRSELAGLLPAAPGRVVVLVDVSGSMQGARIRSAVMNLMPFVDAIEKLYLFNVAVWQHDDFRTIEGLAGLLSMPSGGTALYDAIASVARWESMGDGDLLLVFTDEQENASQMSLRGLSEVRARVAAIVVAPYPADMLLKQPSTRVVAYPGSDPDAVLAAMRLVTAGQLVESEGAVDILRLLPPAARQAKSL